MIIERILKIIHYKKINKNRFYQETGLSNGFFDKVKDVGASKLEYILKTYPEINPEWLLLGAGSMLRPGFEHQKEFDKIPFFKKNILSGYRIQDLLHSTYAKKNAYVIPKFKNNEVDFLIEAESNIMAPKYLMGDILACSLIHNVTFIQWNKPHLIATKGQGVFVKRIMKGATNDFYMMVSDNPQYHPFEVPKDEILDIALIVGFIRLE